MEKSPHEIYLEACDKGLNNTVNISTQALLKVYNHVFELEAEIYRLKKDFKELIGSSLNLTGYMGADIFSSYRREQLPAMSAKEAQLFAEDFIANTEVEGRNDPFWDRAEAFLFEALLLYVINELPPEERNLKSLYRILLSGDSEYIEMLFEKLPPDHPAKIPYNVHAEVSNQVKSGVIIGLGARIETLIPAALL